MGGIQWLYVQFLYLLIQAWAWACTTPYVSLLHQSPAQALLLASPPMITWQQTEIRSVLSQGALASCYMSVVVPKTQAIEATGMKW